MKKLKIISQNLFLLPILILLLSCSVNSNLSGQSTRFYPNKTDYYTISLNGKNLSVKGNAKAEANIELTAPNDSKNQQFRIIEQLKNGKSTNYYLIEPKAKKGLYLTVDYSRIKAGTNIKLNPRKTKNQLWTFKNGAIETALSLNKYIGTLGNNNLVIVDQGPSFTFTKVGNSTNNDYFKSQKLSASEKYFITAKHNNSVFDVANQKLGTVIIPYTKHGGKNQQFQIISKGNGYYSLKSVFSGKVLEIDKGSKKAEAKVVQNTSNGSDHQLFKLIDKGNGYCSIKVKHSGLVLDVSKTIIQYYPTGNGNQLFKFVKARPQSEVEPPVVETSSDLDPNVTAKNLGEVVELLNGKKRNWKKIDKENWQLKGANGQIIYTIPEIRRDEFSVYLSKTGNPNNPINVAFDLNQNKAILGNRNSKISVKKTRSGSTNGVTYRNLGYVESMIPGSGMVMTWKQTKDDAWTLELDGKIIGNYKEEKNTRDQYGVYIKTAPLDYQLDLFSKKVKSNYTETDGTIVGVSKLPPALLPEEETVLKIKYARHLTEVKFAKNNQPIGSFKMVNNDVWAEYKKGIDEPVKLYKEIRRGIYSVYLEDDQGGKILVNMYLKKIMFEKQAYQYVNKYDIVDASNDNLVTANDLTYLIYSRNGKKVGYFRNRSFHKWGTYKISNDKLIMEYDEVGRTESSVILKNKSETIILNLYSGQILVNDKHFYDIDGQFSYLYGVTVSFFENYKGDRIDGYFKRLSNSFWILMKPDSDDYSYWTAKMTSTFNITMTNTSNGQTKKINFDKWANKKASNGYLNMSANENMALTTGPWEAFTPLVGQVQTFRTFHHEFINRTINKHPFRFINSSINEIVDKGNSIYVDTIGMVGSNWVIADAGNGYFTIGQNHKNGTLFLTVNGSINMIVSNAKLGDRQLFRFEKNRLGYVRIISKLRNNLYIGTREARGRSEVVLNAKFGPRTVFKMVTPKGNFAVPARPHSKGEDWDLEDNETLKQLKPSFVAATETKFPSGNNDSGPKVESGSKLEFKDAAFKKISFIIPNSFKGKISQESALQLVTENLNKYLPESFQLSNISTGKDDNDNFELKANASFFNTEGSTISAVFESVKVLQSISINFSKTTNIAVKLLNKITGVTMQSYLPKGVPTPAINVMQINFKGKVLNNITVEGRSMDSWNPIGKGSFGVDDLDIVLGIDNPTKSSREISLNLNGNAKLGQQITLNIEGGVALSKGNVDLILNGTIQDAKIKDILKLLAPDEAAELLLLMPNSIGDLKVDNMKASINVTDQSFVGLMDAKFGTLEMTLRKKPTGKGMGVMLGIQLPSAKELSEINGSLSVLEDLDLSDIAFIISSYNGRAKSNLPTIGQSVSSHIAKGLNLNAIFVLDDKIEQIIKVKKLSLNAKIPVNITNLILEASIETNTDLGGGVTFQRMRFGIKPSPTDFTFFIGGTIAVVVDDTNLEFDGLMKFKPLDQKLEVQFLLSALDDQGAKAVWEEPFGIPGIGLSGLGINVGIGFKPPLPLPSFGLLADVELGTIDDKKIKGRAVIVVDAQNPLKSMIDARLNKLSILAMIEAFSDVEIKGGFRKALGSGFEDLVIRVVPSALTIFGESYEPGLNISGKTNLFGMKGEFDLLFDPLRKISIYGAVDPIEFKSGGTTYFALKGAGNHPKAEIDMVLSANDMHFYLNGSLTLLGMTSSAQVKIDNTGLEANLDINVFGEEMLSASLVVRAKDLNNGGNIYVKAVMKNKLQKKLSQEVRNFINESSQAAQKEYKKLEVALAKAKSGNIIERAFIEVGKQSISNLQRMDAGLANAANYMIKEAFEELLLIEYASFEGKLDAMNGGMVEMKIQGRILGKPLNSTHKMNLKGNIDKMIEDIAEEIGNKILDELKSGFVQPLNNMLSEAETLYTDLGNHVGQTFEQGVGYAKKASEEVGKGVISGAKVAASVPKQLWNAFSF